MREQTIHYGRAEVLCLLSDPGSPVPLESFYDLVLDYCRKEGLADLCRRLNAFKPNEDFLFNTNGHSKWIRNSDDKVESCTTYICCGRKDSILVGMVIVAPTVEEMNACAAFYYSELGRCFKAMHGKVNEGVFPEIGGEV